jgi:hypothetical protein
MLGGNDRKTLFLVTRQWHGMEKAADATQMGQVLSIEAPAPGSAGPSSFTGRNSNLCHFVRTSLSRKAAIPKRWATQKIWHKKREPMIGSLVTNIIKYTLFPAKSQVFHAPWLPPQVPRRWLR